MPEPLPSTIEVSPSAAPIAVVVLPDADVTVKMVSTVSDIMSLRTWAVIAPDVLSANPVAIIPNKSD